MDCAAPSATKDRQARRPSRDQVLSYRPSSHCCRCCYCCYRRRDWPGGRPDRSFRGIAAAGCSRRFASRRVAAVKDHGLAGASSDLPEEGQPKWCSAPGTGDGFAQHGQEAAEASSGRPLIARSGMKCCLVKMAQMPPRASVRCRGGRFGRRRRLRRSSTACRRRREFPPG